MAPRSLQINTGGWNNPTNIYTAIRNPAKQFDMGLGALLTDLSSQPGVQGGSTLLDETLIVAMGEFGRTVRTGGVVGLNQSMGRDHYFNQFAVFAGGGAFGGRVIGSTTDDGGAGQKPGSAQNRNVAHQDTPAAG